MERQVYVAGNQRRCAPSCARTASAGRVPDPRTRGHTHPAGAHARVAARVHRQVLGRVAQVADQPGRVLGQPGGQGQVGTPARARPRRSPRRRPARRRRHRRRGPARVARMPPSRPGLRQAMARRRCAARRATRRGDGERLVQADGHGQHAGAARRGPPGRPAAAAARCTARRARPAGSAPPRPPSPRAERAVGVDLEHEVRVVGARRRAPARRPSPARSSAAPGPRRPATSAPTSWRSIADVVPVGDADRRPYGQRPEALGDTQGVGQRTPGQRAARRRPPPSRRRRASMRSTAEPPKSWATSAAAGSSRPGPRRPRAGGARPAARRPASTRSRVGSTDVPSARAAHSPQPSPSSVTTRTKRRGRLRCTPAAVPMACRNGMSTRTSSTPVSFTWPWSLPCRSP